MKKEFFDLLDKLGQGEYKDGSSSSRGRLYHPIPLRGYEYLAVHKPRCREEADRVAVLIKDGLTILDVGCSTGLY